MINLKELLDDHQTGMSDFQDDYLVTARAGGTLYGQYKQSLRELYKRFRGLREITCDKEKLEVEIEEQEFIKDNDTDKFKQKYAAIEYKRKVMQLEESERSYKDTKREFSRFFKQASFLKEQIGDLTDEKRAVLDKDMWMYKIKEMVCIDWITQGRLGNNTFEFLNACPTKMKYELLTIIKDKDNLLDWYETKEDYLLPDKYLDVPEIDFLELDLPSLINKIE